MFQLMTEDLDKNRSRQYFNVNQSDIRALVRGELNRVKELLISASKRSINTETKYHYLDAVERINVILDPK